MSAPVSLFRKLRYSTVAIVKTKYEINQEQACNTLHFHDPKIPHHIL